MSLVSIGQLLAYLSLAKNLVVSKFTEIIILSSK